jgi:hypothetical protein
LAGWRVGSRNPKSLEEAIELMRGFDLKPSLRVPVDIEKYRFVETS